MIGKVAVSAANFAIDKPYSYAIPQGLTVSVGQRVRIPFGRGNKPAEGIVLAVEEGCEDGLKTIEATLDDGPVLTQMQLQLAAFLRERYFATFYDCLRAMLPAGLWFQTRQTFSLTADRSWKEKTIRKAHAMEVLNLMESLGGQAGEDALSELFSDEEA